jgi:hypothetical protein
VLEEVQDGHVVSSVWAGDGRRLALTYASGTRLDFAHDASKRLKDIVEQSRTVAHWDWIGPGLRPLRRAVENGVTLSFLDDANRRDVGWDAVQRVVRMRYLDRSGRPDRHAYAKIQKCRDGCDCDRVAQGPPGPA